jgi:ATP-dependent Lon protease
MELPFMAIREVVMFPGGLTPFVVGRPLSVRALEEALAGDRRILLVAQRNAMVEAPGADGLYGVGTVSTIVQSMRLPNGNIKVLMEGGERAEVLSIAGGRAEVRMVAAIVERSPQIEALAERVARVAWEHLAGRSPMFAAANPGQENTWHAIGADDPGKLADAMAANLALSFDQKQELLEISDAAKRLTRIGQMLGHRWSDITLSTAVLARWAECGHVIERLGVQLRQEIEGTNRRQRARDLTARSGRVARLMVQEIETYRGGFIFG